MAPVPMLAQRPIGMRCFPQGRHHLCHSRFAPPLLSSTRRGVVNYCSNLESPAKSKEGTDNQDGQIKQTLADLDALLGIKDEPKASPIASGDKADVSISPAVLEKMAVADAAREAARGGTGAGPSGAKAPMTETETVSEQMARILEKARKLAEQQNKSAGQTEIEQVSLKREFEQLLDSLSRRDMGLDKDDMKKLKDAAFGPLTFWVTETLPIIEPDRSGVLIRGNLRDEREKVYAHVCAKVAELFGDRYEVLMVDDAEVEMEMMNGGPGPSSSGSASSSSSSVGGSGGPAAARAKGFGPRVAFQVVPAEQAQPPPTPSWQLVMAVILAGGLVLATGQLSLVANVSKLPKETLDYLSAAAATANNAALDSDALLPGLAAWDPTPYILTSVPIFTSVLTQNFMHEIGHRIAAYAKGVKLGPSFFIPNLSIGSFGAVTPLSSLVKNRRDLWDVAAAGPLAGGLVSLALLVMGLNESSLSVLPKELLVPVPSGLLRGSLLLGVITRLALGEEALHGSEVLISPLLVAGWVGIISTALNLLPVGCLDGGRMVQAAYGRQALSLSSFFTYVGLGLGFLGSSLALPFGLYVLIVQRTAERYVKDSVSPAGDARQAATAVAVLTAILVLLPMAPELAEAFGVGPSNPF